MEEKLTFKKSLQFPADTSAFIYNNYHFGDFYKLKFPFISLYVVTNPSVAQHILIQNESNYEKSKVYWKELRAVIGKALGTVEGDEWLGFKKIHNLSFNPNSIRSYFDRIVRYNKSYMDLWEEEKELDDIAEVFAYSNISIILDTIFGTTGVQNHHEIVSNLADGENIIAYRSRYPWSPLLASLNGKNKQAKKYVDFFDRLSKEAIRQNLDHPEVENLMNHLINESPLKDKQTISLETIRNEMIVYLGASTETAAVAEAWTIYLLSKHPDYLRKVRNEIDALSVDEINESHLDKLTYTTWAVKESIRMYPPSHAIIRDALEDDVIGDTVIKKGDAFYISTYGVHHNPRFWKNADDFLPERFENEKDFAPYTYIPFGAGKHTCIGRFMALPMITLTIAEFLRRFDFELSLKEPVLPVSISTLKPNQPFPVKLIPRKTTIQ